ncbi:MAG: hypothetical protein AAF754_01760 [Pseudomonadota bacterium]
MTYAFLTKATDWVKSMSTHVSAQAPADTGHPQTETAKPGFGYVEAVSASKKKSDGFEGLC